MKSITAIKSTFSSLLSNDLSSLSSFKCHEEGDVKLYINGRFYNDTPEKFLKSYIKSGNEAFKVIDGDFTLIILNS